MSVPDKHRRLLLRLADERIGLGKRTLRCSNSCSEAGSAVERYRQCRDRDEGDPRYYRFQTELNVGSDDMDNATSTNIAVLKKKAQQMIEEQSDALGKLCRELAAKVPAPA